jgi:hypothetical protein
LLIYRIEYTFGCKGTNFLSYLQGKQRKVVDNFYFAISGVKIHS